MNSIKKLTKDTAVYFCLPFSSNIYYDYENIPQKNILIYVVILEEAEEGREEKLAKSGQRRKSNCQAIHGVNFIYNVM